MNGFQRRREQKKQAILQGALSLFIEFGPQKVSIADIADKAKVSQVTIYNYFENKHRLIHEVCIFYVQEVWKEYEQLLNSELPFPHKIQQIIFNKKTIANEIHEDFYTYFMNNYAEDGNYIESFFAEKAMPMFTELFDQGKAEGYVDSTLSNDAILIYIQALQEYLKRDGVYEKALPMTEELTKLLFYGIVGKRTDDIHE